MFLLGGIPEENNDGKKKISVWLKLQKIKTKIIYYVFCRIIYFKYWMTKINPMGVVIILET